MTRRLVTRSEAPVHALVAYPHPPRVVQMTVHLVARALKLPLYPWMWKHGCTVDWRDVGFVMPRALQIVDRIISQGGTESQTRFRQFPKSTRSPEDYTFMNLPVVLSMVLGVCRTKTTPFSTRDC
jgi:hypothetical protein